MQSSWCHTILSEVLSSGRTLRPSGAESGTEEDRITVSIVSLYQYNNSHFYRVNSPSGSVSDIVVKVILHPLPVDTSNVLLHMQLGRSPVTVAESSVGSGVVSVRAIWMSPQSSLQTVTIMLLVTSVNIRGFHDTVME